MKVKLSAKDKRLAKDASVRAWLRKAEKILNSSLENLEINLAVYGQHEIKIKDKSK